MVEYPAEKPCTALTSLHACPSVRQTLYRLNLGNGKSHGKQTFRKDYKP